MQKRIGNWLTAFFSVLAFFLSTEATLAASGDLDPTFGNLGIVKTQTGYSDRADAVAVQADGKILIAGSHYNGWEHLMLARYNSDGSLDQSFATGGIGVYDEVYFQYTSRFTSVHIQSDGKIVASGYARFYPSQCDNYWFITVRFNSDGTIDSSFGGGYILTSFITDPNSYGCFLDSYAYGSAIQPDGKIVLAGTTLNASSQYKFAAARLNPDGSIDTSFASSGKGVFSIGSGDDIAYSVAVEPRSGKLALAGSSYGGSTSYDLGIAKLTYGGGPDLSFGSFGTVRTNIGGNDSALAVACLGTSVVAAGIVGTSTRRFVLAKYSSNGSLDPSFGLGGIAQTSISTYYDQANAVAIQADGRIVAAGQSQSAYSAPSDLALVRYNSNGTPDTTFSGDGKQTTDLNGLNDYGRAIALQADGKIVVAGYSSDGNDKDISLARYLP
jgi:uncharacterized delta-60 repeat protein